MSIILPIPRISSVHIGKLVETRGLLIRLSDDFLVVQEKSKQLDQIGGFPYRINVKSDTVYDLQCGLYIKVIGTVSSYSKKGSNTHTLYLNDSQVTIISEDEADLTSDHSTETFFTESSFKDFHFPTQQELIDALQYHANSEGFKLSVRKRDREKAKLLCYLHCQYGKKQELNTDCQFFINIRRHQLINAPEYWAVATFNLTHNHTIDPFLFVHKTLSESTKELITTMMNNGVDNMRIAKIISEIDGTFLSSNQITILSKEKKKIKKNVRIAESEELREYMKSIGGKFISDDTVQEGGNEIKRKIIATFTTEEYNNLEKFGDFLSVDPTYCSMTSFWTIIPLTVIGAEREIRSAGLIFSSSGKSEMWRWILKILLEQLPTKDKLETLCSDDDVGLDGCFTETANIEDKTETDLKILDLNRVICFWHKIENFNKYIATLQLPQDKEDKYKYYFKLMGMTRDENLFDYCHRHLEKNEKIRMYLAENVDPKINNIAKCKINFFTCGYNTSSISESMNSRLKRIAHKKPLTLTEIREQMTFTEHYSMCTKRFIKGRKMKMTRTLDVVEIMTLFNVSQSIAEAISGSIQKAANLDCEIINQNLAKITQKKDDSNLGKELTETYFITDGQCSCLKQISTGLPCSHFIKYLLATGNEVYRSIMIHPRYILSGKQPYEVSRNLFNEYVVHEKATVVTDDEKTRFILLRSQSIALSSIASKTQKTFNIFKECLSNAEEKIEQASNCPEIVDQFGTRPGRKRRGENDPSKLKCGICNGSHATARCPYKEEMKAFAPPGSTKEGSRHCSLCDYSGHNAASCPARKAWIEHRISKSQSLNDS